MSTPITLTLRDDRGPVIAELKGLGDGQGWCNLSPHVVDDVDPIQVNIFGLWANRGTPVATYLTNAPRKGEPVPSMVGVLHTRGKLGAEYLRDLVGDAPLRLVQNHAQRGLLFEAPVDVDVVAVLDVMCRATRELCEFELAEGFTVTVFRH